MYLLQTNCSKGSALEGCALEREGGGPRGHKRACLSIRKTLWRLLLRSEMGFGGSGGG